MERIGFLGLGLMGHGMAHNIVTKGWPLTLAAHRSRAALEDLVSKGAVEGGIAQVAGCDIVFLCVTGSPQVESLVRQMAPHMREGSVVVDCSTSDPVSTAALAAELATRGVTLVDAPLSRTPKEAWAGALDVMVGASDAVFARVQPVIAAFAGKIVHIGGPGDGHRMKLLNNFLSLGYAALYSEALVLAQKVGISPPRFDQVIRGGRMDCGFYQTFMGYMIEGNREAHKFTLSNAAKDLRYLEAMADAAGVANPVGNAVKNAFVAALATGGAGPEDYVPHLPLYVGRANGMEMEP